ncbi:hypothetical protein BKH42_08580 [Helicobacter sp. 13S00482-2]|uniref:hypothetical protein n=1 Tax=Helicobacter sp. 13S00482-2 TaxID=1476200 RepID=UPI000BA6A0DF|nr:hypothetical protein [Helicobacter sp. 13S00482-2]PAF52938.1 hypothetical protein BKH42_08580 [Helicobacter sp. 13S00482-2]
MKEISINLEHLSKDDLIQMREDLQTDINLYEQESLAGVEIDPELIFKTQSVLFAIEEILENSTSQNL